MHEGVLVELFLLVHLVAGAAVLFLLIGRHDPLAVRDVEDSKQRPEGPLLGVEVQVVEVSVAAVHGEHVFTVLFLGGKGDWLFAGLAVPGAAARAVLIGAVDVPFLEPPLFLLFLLFMFEKLFLVYLDNLVKEIFILSCGSGLISLLLFPLLALLFQGCCLDGLL